MWCSPAAAVMPFLPHATGGSPLDHSLNPPSFPEHAFGFDLQGCDLLLVTVAGTRNSLLVGVLATIFALAVAIPVATQPALPEVGSMG